MKQPELGRKITELRKEKGLTQEELVDKCNISVRTLQRIEAGEVTPRDYTIKTILAALDLDLSIIATNDRGLWDTMAGFLMNMFLIDIDEDRSADYLVRQLTMAWIFGLVSFLLGFPEAAADYFLYINDEMIFNTTLYIVLKVLVLGTFFFFVRGFILIGYLYQNYLLKITSYILLFAVTLSTSYDIFNMFIEPVAVEFTLGAESLLYGAVLLIFGVSLLRLQRALGNLAIFAGLSVIMAGGLFLTVILGFLGGIVLIPAELFEIVIIYKVAENIRSKRPVNPVMQ